MTTDNLSLMRGGPVHSLLDRIGRIHPGLKTSRVIALALVVLALVPLVLSTALDGTLAAGKVTIPLSADYAVLARLLLVIPVLVLAAPQADRLLRAAVRQFSRSRFVRDDQQAALDAILVRARRLRDSWIPELACLLVAVIPATTAVRTLDLAHLSSWHGQDGDISWAGHWFNLVSIPAFRLVALLWLSRFVLWTWLLWRFARLELDLRPAHPDHAGGLGFLGVAQTRFAPLAFAGGLLLSGTCLNHFFYAGQTLTDMRYLLAGYVAASTLLLAPLLLLSVPLLRAKRHALPRYAILGQRAVRLFDARWKKGEVPGGVDSLIESANPSALADFTTVYETVSRMSIVPANRRIVIHVLLAAGLPLVPLVFFAMSLDELVKRLASILV